MLVARSGGRSFSSAPALNFIPFSRSGGGNLLRRKAPTYREQTQFIFLCLWEQRISNSKILTTDKEGHYKVVSILLV
jgi:hypothetical protein